ncbi:MAG: Na(+)-translocating NADH-quinone reductase subunit C [Candidatus Dadabacteria bacterium]|nr:MAG: Na(+)-translocating NADH-quinone reductase subunit C [Candidatus Dadabacteria bacterium]
MSASNDTVGKTIIVAASVAIVCSVLVSSAAVLLKPYQEKNKALDLQKNVLEAAGLLHDDTDVATAFSKIERRVIDLDTGAYTTAVDPDTYDQRRAEKDPNLSDKLPREADIAGIGRREHYAQIYIVRTPDGAIDKVILPIRGYGLWSTLRGFLCVEADGNTICGLTYYEHAETPGLGGEVDNPRWKALWHGKKIYDDNGAVALDVIKGRVDASAPGAEHKVDGLSGATLTSNGVEHMMHFWLGDQGYHPFLRKLQQGAIS